MWNIYILLKSVNRNRIIWYTLDGCKLIQNILIASWGVETYIEYFNLFLRNIHSYRIFWYTLEKCKLILNIFIYSWRM